MGLTLYRNLYLSRSLDSKIQRTRPSSTENTAKTLQINAVTAISNSLRFHTGSTNVFAHARGLGTTTPLARRMKVTDSSPGSGKTGSTIWWPYFKNYQKIAFARKIRIQWIVNGSLFHWLIMHVNSSKSILFVRSRSDHSVKSWPGHSVFTALALGQLLNLNFFNMAKN